MFPYPRRGSPIWSGFSLPVAQAPGETLGRGLRRAAGRWTPRHPRPSHHGSRPLTGLLPLPSLIWVLLEPVTGASCQPDLVLSGPRWYPGPLSFCSGRSEGRSRPACGPVSGLREEVSTQVRVTSVRNWFHPASSGVGGRWGGRGIQKVGPGSLLLAAFPRIFPDHIRAVLGFSWNQQGKAPCGAQGGAEPVRGAGACLLMRSCSLPGGRGALPRSPLLPGVGTCLVGTRRRRCAGRLGGWPASAGSSWATVALAWNPVGNLRGKILVRVQGFSGSLLVFWSLEIPDNNC